MNRTIYLSAGHSFKDPGAISGSAREADIAVEMRNMVSAELNSMGVLHRVDGIGAQNPPLTQAIIEARKADFPVEFHCNSFATPTATGVETLQGAEDKALGAEICAVIAGALGIKNRGAKPENSGHHARLGFVGAGGIIVEMFFISNPDDLAKWRKNKAAAARAVAGVLAQAARR